MSKKSDENIKYITDTVNLIDNLKNSGVDQMIFSTCFKDIKIIKENNDEIFLEVNNKKVKDVIENVYITTLKDGLKQVINKNKSIILSYQNNKKIDIARNKEKIHENYVTKSLTFDNYVGAEFNRDALRAVKHIYQNDQVIFNPIFIYSNSGFGKTHLLHALGNKLIQNKKTVIYINPDTFTKKASYYMQNKDSISLDKLIDNFKKYDVLMFDDIQNFGGRKQTLDVVFNIFNHRIENNQSTVFCADETPSELGGFPKRFITRFNGGLIINIKKPSLNDLVKILKQNLVESKLNLEKWEENALKFVAKNYSKSIRDLKGGVSYIKFHENDLKQITKYNTIVIESIFKDTYIKKNVLTIEEIIKYISKYYKVSKNDIKGKSRKTQIVIARHVSMWLSKELTKASQKEIGEKHGNKDHSTVNFAIQKMETMQKINESLKNSLKKIKKEIINRSNFE